MTTTSRPMRKDAARNRSLLVAAAREVFARRGLDATLDDVARQAGVGVGTAYRHFANKQELAAAIMTETLDAVVAHARAALEVDDAWLGLAGFVEAVLELQAADRGLREVLMGTHDPDGSDEVYDRLSGPVAAIMDRARTAAVVRADVADTDLGFVITMLCVIADMAGDTAPELWRRYLPGLLATLREGGADDSVPALSDAQFRTAAAAHKAKSCRATTMR